MNLPSFSADTFDEENYVRIFIESGFTIVEDVLKPKQIDCLQQAIAALPDGVEVRRKRSVYGVRNLLAICPPVQSIAADPRLRRFVTPLLGNDAFAVRATFFDKVPGANWSLFWHQDNVIPVAERIEAPGFSCWSKKAGVWHVQPPAEVLAKMVAVRIHLDDCGAENGPLRVLAGSHRSGWLDGKVDDWKQNAREFPCIVRAGGIVAMCPLTLHASAPAAPECVSHRRVIHIEYAAAPLPAGLRWFQQVR